MKNLMKLAILGALVSPLVLGASQAFAEDTQEPTKSTGKVNFEKSDVDGKGEIYIDSASNMNFGTLKIKGDADTYDAIYEADSTWTDEEGRVKIAPLSITTVDNRGNGAGWSINARMSQVFTGKETNGVSVETGYETLEKATITLDVHEAVTNKPLDAREAPNVMPNSPVTLKLDSAETLLTADEGQGIGTWTTLFGDLKDEINEGDQYAGAKLHIPSGTKIQEKIDYVAEIEWSLLLTPELVS